MMSDLAKRTLTILILAPLSLYLLWMGKPYVEGLVALLTLGLGVEVYRMSKNWHWPFRLSVLLYIVMGMNGLFLAWEYSPSLIYWILLIVWSNDIGAYLIGRSVGGPKLAPTISPKKTWSGFVGGILCAMTIGFLSSTYITLPSRILAYPLFIAFSISFAGNIGDLVESLLKRQAKVKDSGSILPGHGGLFDRLDSLVFVGVIIVMIIIWQKWWYSL